MLGKVAIAWMSFVKPRLAIKFRFVTCILSLEMPTNDRERQRDEEKVKENGLPFLVLCAIKVVFYSADLGTKWRLQKSMVHQCKGLTL